LTNVGPKNKPPTKQTGGGVKKKEKTGISNPVRGLKGEHKRPWGTQTTGPQRNATKKQKKKKEERGKKKNGRLLIRWPRGLSRKVRHHCCRVPMAFCRNAIGRGCGDQRFWDKWEPPGKKGPSIRPTEAVGSNDERGGNGD